MRSGNMPQSLYQNWQFAIEVNGFDVALFKKGQEPKTEFEEVAFAPAGSMFDQTSRWRRACSRTAPTRPPAIGFGSRSM